MCQFEYLQRKILPETAMQDDINHKVLSEESTIVVFIMSKVACECRGYHIFSNKRTSTITYKKEIIWVKYSFLSCSLESRRCICTTFLCTNKKEGDRLVLGKYPHLDGGRIFSLMVITGTRRTNSKRASTDGTQAQEL